MSLIARETGEPRFWVGDHADRRPCQALIAETIPADGTPLYTDEWQSYRGSHPAHAAARHGIREWARDHDGDGRREVHGNTCEEAGAALRTSLRAFRGVHKPYLHLDVAPYEAMVNAQCSTPALIRRRCLRSLSKHSSYT
jgi:hypothetical protein